MSSTGRQGKEIQPSPIIISYKLHTSITQVANTYHTNKPGHQLKNFKRKIVNPNCLHKSKMHKSNELLILCSLNCKSFTKKNSKRTGTVEEHDWSRILLEEARTFLHPVHRRRVAPRRRRQSGGNAKLTAAANERRELRRCAVQRNYERHWNNGIRTSEVDSQQQQNKN